MKFDLLNDPKLTAFALGELQGQEAIEMANLIDKDPEAQKAVEEIRRTSDLLSSELKKEELPRLSVIEREKVLNAEPKARFKFSKWMIGLPASVAATIALVFLVQNKMKDFVDSHFDNQFIATTEPPQQAPSGQMTVERPRAEEPKVSGLEPAKPAVPPKKVSQGRGEMEPYEFEEHAEPADDAAMVAQAPAAAGAPPPPAAASSDLAAPAPPAKSKFMFKEGAQMQGKRMAAPGIYGNLIGGGSGAMGPVHEPNVTNESYRQIDENKFISVADEALSTFSIDVDTASYANVRRMLVGGSLPPKDAVRIEEMLNYFKYDYATPKDNKPFAANVEIATAPWNTKHPLVRVGLKGKEMAKAELPASNLVFLIDVSGSMMDENKLPLVQKSLKMLVENLRAKDRVSLVVYAGASGIVLDSTPGDKKTEINEAIDRLTAGGSTHGSAGIQQAYEIGTKNFIKGGINRVILATDGDFNMGMTSESDLGRLIEEKAKSGVFLSVLGFGMGNLKDSNMQKLANQGNGNHAYIDSLREARKVLVEQAGGTLNTIAKDVKIQIEFNPKFVAGYRLIGYEKRMLQKQDFNDDQKDAGEIGEGHTVTALYEIIPAGEAVPGAVDALKYQAKKEEAKGSGEEMLTLKLRYKEPEGSTSKLIEIPVKHEKKEFERASSDFKFAASVAGFGMILRDSQQKGDMTLQQVQDIASRNLNYKGQPDEYRTEFVELVKKAKSLKKK